MKAGRRISDPAVGSPLSGCACSSHFLSSFSPFSSFLCSTSSYSALSLSDWRTDGNGDRAVDAWQTPGDVPPHPSEDVPPRPSEGQNLFSHVTMLISCWSAEERRCTDQKETCPISCSVCGGRRGRVSLWDDQSVAPCSLSHGVRHCVLLFSNKHTLSNGSSFPTDPFRAAGFSECWPLFLSGAQPLSKSLAKASQ